MRKLINAKTKSIKPVRGVRMRVNDDLVAKFLTHAGSSPDSLAVITTDTSLTYQQLYDDVLRWKARLRQYRFDKAVICLERSPRLLSLLIALQWLEITYIPVDPSIPVERLKAIIEDSHAQALLYDTADADYSQLPCLQLAINDLEKTPVKTSKPQTQKKNPIAYIIYTSGSTGSPKGVAISRTALNNFLAAMSRNFMKEEQSLLLAITTIAFDIAVLELFLPLWQQKTVFLANQQQHKDPFAITKILNDYPITLLQATPAMWKMLNDVDWQGKSKLIALCGGEPLTPTLAKRLLSEVAQLWNMYGPTEATVWCSLKQILPNKPITIGKPIANMEMRVMDSAFNILPPYVKGELYIGGIGLAEGYVNNAELTQSRFMPFSNALAKRLYRVGDIACSTPDGEFIIYGRTDNQIKLHGYRIELEDIEAHIQSIPGIRESAVIVYHEQLVAYLSLNEPETFSETEFLSLLARDLPDYMLPKRLVILEKLPQTTSGKTDRKALPRPSQSSTTEITDVTPLQLSLISIWAEELAVPSVGIHDNFFELGGHSLMAARITAKISQRIEKKISLNDFYQAPTIEQLAELIENTEDSQEFFQHHKKHKGSNSSWLPLNDFQLVLWISRTFEPKLKKFNIVERRRFQGPLNKKALDSALQLVFQKHEVFSYGINRLYPAQKRQKKRLLKWEEVSLVDFDEKACEDHLVDSFNALSKHYPWRNQTPMLIGKLFYLKDEQIEIQISMPHLLTDDNSIEILFRDLSNAYLYYAHHTPLIAKESFHPYRSYAIQQNEQLIKHAEVDEVFWKNYLRDASLFYFPEKYVIRNLEKQKLPFSTYIEIPELILTKIRKFCVRNRVNISDVLCAATSLSLLNCCKNETEFPQQLLINTVKSTRDDPHFDNVIGCFLRLHPIIMNLNKERTLVSLAKQAHRSTLETTEHQRTSSLVKLASIGQLPCGKKNIFRSLFSLVTSVLSKVSQSVNINPTVLKACATLSSFERRNNFIININILGSFVADTPKKNQQPLFGVPNQAIPHYSFDLSNVEYVFDVCFLRDSNRNIPFVVISANLTPAFKERFGKTLLAILQEEEEVVC